MCHRISFVLFSLRPKYLHSAPSRSTLSSSLGEFQALDWPWYIYPLKCGLWSQKRSRVRSKNMDPNSCPGRDLDLGPLTWQHWRRLVKNIEWANQNVGGQRVVKSNKCMCISQ